ncbi:hypothetical protein Ga0100231_021345 [Opitutaceae bacterium TAV4]|nr:hypothetical protein Ga0100231_021345 [Opitutaceae bacterium TAV4]RRJ99754.1 hypothetical protein Ga0100230_016960 [Opitutaceae bacterium TAV3]
MKKSQWWSLLWLFVRVVVGLIVLGAALGAVVFPLCGWGLGMSGVTYGQMALTGARTLGFYIGVVWGPGIGVVICAIRAHRERTA